jgi:hypothetical protein
VSVIPLPAATEPTPAETTSATTVLRLVPRHEHTWELRVVDFDEGLEVRRYECRDCDDVQFR